MAILLISLFATLAGAEGNCTNELPKALQLLGPNHKASTWIETTANDHKPLFIQLSEKDKKIYLYFFKTKEGVWAQGTAQVCEKNGKDKFIAKIAKTDILLGDKIPWPIKLGFKGGGEFTLTTKAHNVLGISTFGWGGDFVASTDTELEAAKNALPKQ
jgi:hypothetical protein